MRGVRSTAIAVRSGPSGVVVADNRTDGGEIGLQVRDARAAVRANAVTGATSHGVSVVGAADGSTVEGNSLAGAGASALDVVRVTAPAAVAVGPNDVSGWRVEVSLSEYVADTVRDHPLLPLWALVLLAPLALVFVRRRLGSRPYVEGGGVVEPPATHDISGETLLIPVSGIRPPASASTPPGRREGRGVRSTAFWSEPCARSPWPPRRAIGR